MQGFRWRGHEVSRIEGFSDAAFGFALTLLVASQQVPHNYQELMGTMRGFIAFLLSFSFLSMIWYNHYLFFRHYGLEDIITIRLNLLLLVMVLFSVYPLKFLFTLVVASYLKIAPPEGMPIAITLPQMLHVLTIYGLGLSAIFLIFALLHKNAYRQRKALALNILEQFDTRQKIVNWGLISSVALLSALFALAKQGAWASIIYLLIPLLRVARDRVARPRRQRLALEVQETPAE